MRNCSPASLEQGRSTAEKERKKEKTDEHLGDSDLTVYLNSEKVIIVNQTLSY